MSKKSFNIKYEMVRDEARECIAKVDKKNKKIDLENKKALKRDKNAILQEREDPYTLYNGTLPRKEYSRYRDMNHEFIKREVHSNRVFKKSNKMQDSAYADYGSNQSMMSVLTGNGDYSEEDLIQVIGDIIETLDMTRRYFISQETAEIALKCMRTTIHNELVNLVRKRIGKPIAIPSPKKSVEQDPEEADKAYFEIVDLNGTSKGKDGDSIDISELIADPRTNVEKTALNRSYLEYITRELVTVLLRDHKEYRMLALVADIAGWTDTELRKEIRDHGYKKTVLKAVKAIMEEDVGINLEAEVANVKSNQFKKSNKDITGTDLYHWRYDGYMQVRSDFKSKGITLY